ncbi:MAG: hypothetical protein EOM28_07870 [Clostridia bacterium]|nr:hypothetical protein [Clostridia bacterium]
MVLTVFVDIYICPISLMQSPYATRGVILSSRSVRTGFSCVKYSALILLIACLYDSYHPKIDEVKCLCIPHCYRSANKVSIPPQDSTKGIKSKCGSDACLNHKKSIPYGPHETYCAPNPIPAHQKEHPNLAQDNDI